MKRILFIVNVFLMFLDQTAIAEETWKLEKNKNEIKVWTRKPVNSSLKEFKSITSVNSALDKVVSYFRNYKSFDKWMYRVIPGSVKQLKLNNENDFYIQVLMSAPLIKTREIITRYLFSKPDEKGAITITVENAFNILPENDDYVRVKKITAIWKFTPLANNKTEIYHQAITDPGGSIPTAFINMAIADAPFTMLSKLKETFK